MAEGRIAIAMSGGVDSSTAALILKDAGWDLVGFSMQLWDRTRNISEDEEIAVGGCCSPDDFYDAREVAARLNIPYYVVDFQEEFERTIVRSFIEDYRKGLTPSPCVLCNSKMKFDRLARMADEVHATHIATGHYARVGYEEESGRYLLLRAADRSKDQAYFLFELNQEQLAKAVFPLGGLTKEQVRETARRHGLVVADKSESQEICFIPDGDYAAFIERNHDCVVGKSGEISLFAPGQIVGTDGRILGVHQGIHRFTIGQRRGLGIAHTSPLYVVEIRPEENRVVIGERSELGRDRCRVIRTNWISIPDLFEPLQVQAKIRSRHPEAPATITPMNDGSVEVLFDDPQPAVSPGQACVFYQDDVVVGGGWIDRDKSNKK
ncbi:MAG: tRNA 2-thiouridine(34) synthase MnmA [Acidobacteria bacterium]|nr:tRNA 2-thiouridine(34) synthase MnmA [Acidobacteriota bacterium]